MKKLVLVFLALGLGISLIAYQTNRAVAQGTTNQRGTGATDPTSPTGGYGGHSPSGYGTGAGSYDPYQGTYNPSSGSYNPYSGEYNPNTESYNQGTGYDTGTGATPEYPKTEDN